MQKRYLMANQLYRCRHFGCSELITVSAGYCTQHTPFQNVIEGKRAGSTERGYNIKWQQARKRYLRLNPLCRECGQPATDIDHIIPHKGNKLLFWNTVNWQPLCHKCHSHKTLRESTYIPQAEILI